MTIKKKIIDAFKHKLLAPQMERMDAWEQMVVDYPGSMRGNENSPVRFNIPKEAIKRDTDKMPLPGFPASLPQMVGSIINTRKSVLELEENLTNGQKRIDEQTFSELKSFAKGAGADKIGFCVVPREWVFRDTAIA